MKEMQSGGPYDTGALFGIAHSCAPPLFFLCDVVLEMLMGWMVVRTISGLLIYCEDDEGL